MNFLHLLPIFVCLLFALSPTSAHETTDTGWPIEERCLGEPTPPSDDWTFPGAILMTGHFGIHAISADTSTPYVAAFLQENKVIPGGKLSPNGEWYATPVGDTRPSGLHPVETFYGVNGIEIHQMRYPSTVYEVSWLTGYSYVAALPPPIIWLDNEHFLYDGSDGDSDNQPFLIDPFTGESRPFGSELDIFEFFYPSPDGNRAIATQAGTQFGIYALDTDQLIEGFERGFKPYWSPDSLSFAAEVKEDVDGEPAYKMVWFDRDGTIMDVIFDFAKDQRIYVHFTNGLNIAAWSSGGRYFAFVSLSTTPRVFTLYIADTQEKRVYNTCIETSDGLAWSPHNNMLALIDFYDNKPHRPVMVLDLDSWALHTVAYHEGNIIGWRGD